MTTLLPLLPLHLRCLHYLPCGSVISTVSVECRPCTARFFGISSEMSQKSSSSDSCFFSSNGLFSCILSPPFQAFSVIFYYITFFSACQFLLRFLQSFRSSSEFLQNSAFPLAGCQKKEYNKVSYQSKGGIFGCCMQTLRSKRS